jgi:hypothetical protein
LFSFSKATGMRSKGCLCLLIAAACTSGPAAAPPSPEPGGRIPASQPSTIPEAGPASWTFSHSSSPRSYVVTESTSIVLDERRDSSVTETRFSIVVQPVGQDTAVRGTIDQVSGPSGGTVNTLPFVFSGTVHGGGISIDSIGGQRLPAVLTCDNPAMSRLSAVRRNVFVAPAVLSRNQTWTDSSTVPACSGTVPVQVTTVRTYRVVGEIAGAIIVERQDRIMSSGEGAQGQHRITIQSRGTGSSQLRLDRFSGALVSSTGLSQVEVDVGSSGRVQRFVQLVRDRVTAGEGPI